MVEAVAHQYTPAVVGVDDTASYNVKNRALSRQMSGIRPILTGVSNKVYHFQVPSYSRWTHQHRVEYDAKNETFRCSCEGGFYGVICHHIELIRSNVKFR